MADDADVVLEEVLTMSITIVILLVSRGPLSGTIDIRRRLRLYN